MSTVPVRERLARDAFLVLACYVTVHAVVMTGRFGIGWDAHAYYVAWTGDLYEAAPESVDAYNYSPLFAQVIWPLTQLPWPAFCALFIGAAAASVTWLVRPLPRVWAVGLWLFCTAEILSGNVFWLLAVATVLGLRRGSPWCVAAFTKVLPCLGPVWFALRGEWRPLVRFTTTAAALFLASYALDPGLWHSWWDFLRDSAGDSSGKVYLSFVAFTFPLVLRVPLALALVAFAARTDRAWLLPVAMVIASPVVGWGTFALLAAIPRLRLATAPTPREARISEDGPARSLTT